MGIMREFNSALKNTFGSMGQIFSAGPTSGITRTRHYSGACELNAIWVAADILTAAADTQAFWSIDDSAVSASGSAGAAIVGGFIGETTAYGQERVIFWEFMRPIPLANGLTFNYTATGTGCALRYSIWITPKRDPSLI